MRVFTVCSLILLAISIASCAMRPSSPLGARPESPEAVARAFFSALEASEWEQAASLVHPATAAKIRQSVLSHVAAWTTREIPTVELLRRFDPEMPEEVAEYQVRRARETLTREESPLLYMLARVRTAAEVEALSDREVLARYLEAQDPRYQFQRAREQVDRFKLPDVAPPRNPPRMRHTVLGHVLEADSLAHVVYRAAGEAEGAVLPEEHVAVLSLVQTPQGWRVRNVNVSGLAHTDVIFPVWLDPLE